jgi:CheY-like chemotaxis protein
LERFGYRVLLASNGAEALGLYAQHREQISVVLTDMAMPIMDGPSTIIALKAMNPKVNIIGSSGLASNGGVAKAVGAGVKHFVPKPYTAETLLKVLAEALREDA